MDYTHEDLKDKMWINPCEQSELEGIYGYDFCNVDNDPMDDGGHGTHCAGIIAAEENNAVGIVGLASRINIKIMALKVFGENGKGTMASIVSAYNYIYRAQCLGINVVAVNNSWGGTIEPETLENIIEIVGNNGALSVCSAGNNSENIDVNFYYPTKYESDYIISVAACNETGALASFSNYGKKNVDIVAPGVNILSTVPYNNFAPYIYENPEEVCQLYNTFAAESYEYDVEVKVSSNVINLNNDEGISILNNGKGETKVERGYTINSVGRECEKNASMKWEVKKTQRGETYWLMLPYSVLASETDTYRTVSVKMNDSASSSTYHTSCYVMDIVSPENGLYFVDDEDQIGIVYSDREDMWSTFTGKICDASEKDSQRFLLFRLDVKHPGDYDIYIDNLGVSKENISDEYWVKYDYMSGTSMACPYVTAAVALSSEKYPDDSALETKERIMTSVQFDDSLSELIATGGRIDLSRLDNPENVVTKLEFVGENIIRLAGYNLGDCDVRLNGKNAEILSQTENEIQVNATGLVNQKVMVQLIMDDEIKYSDYCSKIVTKAPEYCGTVEGSIEGNYIISNGNEFWYLSDEKDVYKGIPTIDNGEESIKWINCNEAYGLERVNEKKYIYGSESNESLSNYSKIIYNNNKLYMLVNVHYRYYYEEQEKYDYQDVIKLLEFDEISGWKAIADMDIADVGSLYYSLFAYNNNIYIIAGLDSVSNKFMKTVYKYIPSDNENEKGNVIVADDIPELPEGRGNATGVQVGNKLILTLVTCDEPKCPNNLIFDGKEWKVSKENPEITKYLTGQWGTKYTYNANVGIVEDGIIYTGTESKYHGTIFKYNVEKDEFECMEYGTSFDEEIYENVVASTMGDKLYLLADSSADEESFELYKIPVECGYLYVEDSSEENGYIEGANRYYLWSEMISLCGKAEADCYLYSLSVNGQIIEGEGEEVSFKGLASDYYKTGMMVNGQFGEYVTEAYLRDYDLIVLKPGESVSVKCAILPTNAYNKNVYFECDVEGLIIQDGNVISMSEDAELETLYLVNIVSADRDETVGSFFVVCNEEYYTVPRLSSWIYIDGYQISTKAEGVRVLYSVDKSNEGIESFGLVYGLADYCTEADLIVDSPNSTVYSFEATPAGKNVMSDTTNHTFEDYVMTMKFIDSAKFYDSEIMVTAYLKNKDGTYEYTEVKTFSVYDIADYLYTKQLMTSYERHCYLFDNILSVVNDTYSPIEYNWENTLAQ